MKLCETLSPECVKLPLSSIHRDGVIDELVDRLTLHQRIDDPSLMRREMAARQAFMSGRIGRRAAIAHIQSSACPRQSLAVGRMKKPMFNAVQDDRPVDLMFLLVTPLAQPARHIEAMARISLLMKDPQLAAAIQKAPDPQAMVDLLTLVDLTDNPTWTHLVV